MAGRPALFLDRDGTLVHSRAYPARPHELVLYDGIAPLMREAQACGFALVVITNQAGLAHGLFTELDLAAMHEHLIRELAFHDVQLDAIYHCPHHPQGVVPELTRTCDCRKPKPGMILAAAGDLDIDLGASWMIGDRLDDVEAGASAGCRTILIDLGTEPIPDDPLRVPSYVARDTMHALHIALGGQAGTTELGYRPTSWGLSSSIV